MRRDYFVEDAATFEMIEAEFRYELRRPGLGDRLHGAILVALDRVADDAVPARRFHYLPKTSPVRWVPLGVFPYKVVFVDGRPRRVIALAHGSRAPAYWVDRR